MLVIDLDSFRLVNETYRLLTGNEVLQLSGGSCSALQRVHEIVRRHGGEEFVVLLPAVEDDLFAVAGRAPRQHRSNVERSDRTGSGAA